MNKKFSTLVAALLLAGGALSPALAQKLSSVANDGKYYKIKAAYAYDFGGRGWIPESDGYYLDLDEVNGAQISQSDDDYWKVVKVANDTYELINFAGNKLTVNSLTQYAMKEDLQMGGEVLKASQLQLSTGAWVAYATPAPNKLQTQVEGSTSNYGTAFTYVASSAIVDMAGADPYISYWELDPDDIEPVNFVYNAGDHYAQTNVYQVSYNKTTKTWKFKNNATGVAVKATNARDAAEEFYVRYDDDHGTYLQDPITNKYVKLTIANNVISSAALVDELIDATFVGFASVGDNAIRVDLLNKLEKDGFSVTIYHDAKDDDCFDKDHAVTSIAGNPFTGHLTTMAWEDGKFVQATSGYSFYLKNAEGNFIVAKKYEGQGDNENQVLYGFTTVSEAALVEDLARTQNAGLPNYKQQYFGEFTADVDGVDFDADPTMITKVTELTWLGVNIKEVDAVNNYYIVIGRYDFAGKPTLVASEGTDLKPILISLGDRNIVDWTDFVQNKFFTIEKITKDKTDNGKLAAYDNVGKDWAYVKSYGNVLEGQWALTVNFEDAAKKVAKSYTFTNRENPKVTFEVFDNANALYTVSGATDTYAYQGDTYVIKAVSTKDSDGYARLDVKSEQNQNWNIAFASNVFGGQAYLTENHDDSKDATYHVIGLDTDVDNALQFSIKQYAAPRTVKMDADKHEYKYTPTDSVYVISTLGTYDKKKGYVEVKDTLRVLSYSFVNQWNEPLVYAEVSNGDNAYQSQVWYEYTDAGKKKTAKFANNTLAYAHENAQKFAVRYDGERYNLRPLHTVWKGAKWESQYHGDELMYQEFNNRRDLRKMYAGDATNGILDQISLYDRTENDLFVIEETSKDIYRSLEGANANGLDTISIYRDENNKSLLYEKSVTLTADNNKVVNFLGMENIADFTEMAPAMLADTAYVRNETYKPQYLLVVNPTIVPAGKWCDVHQTADCEHAVPTKGLVSGRFLVSLQDTAAVWADANKHKAGNPYLNSEGYAKLGFVQATHYNDTLAITREKPTAADSLYLGNNDFNVAKFAFKYVDTESKSFVIETKDGFLKWMNGYVVVVPNEKNADIFNLNEDEDRNPTANEAIAAEGVQVIAGKGVVTVQGAAGKVITVANILGQTIANQVAASDNVTIAAPTGVVVVAVDGEATKVVVK